MKINKFGRTYASKRSVDYLLILFNDSHFDTTTKKFDFIERVTGRKVCFVSDLTQSECSMCIDELKTQKENKRASTN